MIPSPMIDPSFHPNYSNAEVIFPFKQHQQQPISESQVKLNSTDSNKNDKTIDKPTTENNLQEEKKNQDADDDDDASTISSPRIETYYLREEDKFYLTGCF